MNLSGILNVFIQRVNHNTSLPTTEIENEQPGGNWFPTAEQADAALASITKHDESQMMRELRQISAETSDKLDRVLKIEVPKGNMTKAEYEQEFVRAGLRQAGVCNPTDSEIAHLQYQFRRLSGSGFSLQATRRQLNDLAQNGTLSIAVSERALAVMRVGADEIHRQRNARTVQAARAREQSQAYGADALAGFYKLQANGAVNVANEATKLLALPAIPNFEVRGEYWHNKKKTAEAATTTTAVVLSGGAGLAGELLIVSASGAGLAESLVGSDLRTGAELSSTERVMRGAGGLLGAYASRGRVDQITEAVADRTRGAKTVAREAVTPEGLRLPLPERKSLGETLARPMEARVQSRINIRQGDGTKGSGFDYAMRRHGGTGTANKSQFSIPHSEIKELLQRKEVISAKILRDALSGNYIREVDVGIVIGHLPLKLGGQPTSVMTVITDEAGNLVNLFPGTLKFGEILP